MGQGDGNRGLINTAPVINPGALYYIDPATNRRTPVKFSGGRLVTETKVGGTNFRPIYGEKVLGKDDLISKDTASYDDGAPDTTTRPVWGWSPDELKTGVFTYPTAPSGREGAQARNAIQKQKAADALALPAFNALVSTTRITPEEKFQKFASQYRGALYGAHYASSGGGDVFLNGYRKTGNFTKPVLDLWNGEKLDIGAETEEKANYSVQKAQQAMELMDTLYGHLPQAQRDKAAYDNLVGRGKQYWYGDAPTTVVQDISSRLGGLPAGIDMEKWNAYTASSYQGALSFKRAADKAEDAKSKGEFMKVLGIAGGFLVPGLGNVLSGALGQIGGNLAAGAIIGGATSAIGGGDILKGALGGAVSGAIGGSGIGNTIGNSIGGSLGGLSNTAQGALNAGVTGALKGTAGSLIQGNGFGDALEFGLISGVASGVGSYVGQTVKDAMGGAPVTGSKPDDFIDYDKDGNVIGKGTVNVPINDGAYTPNNIGSVVHDKVLDNWYTNNTDGNSVSSNFNPANTLGNAAGGATTGLINSGLSGGNALNGALIGGAAGAANGAVKDMGGSNVAAGAVGGLVGSVVKNELKDTPPTTGSAGSPTTGNSNNTPAPTKRPFGSVTDDMFGFGSVIFQDLSSNRNVNFNARKFGG
jgi:hypothetical protein